MSNVLNEEKQKQVVALGQLGWSLRKIEKATGVRRFPRGQTEGLAFALERGEWRIGGMTRR